jgi:hypothetical protein
LARFREWRFFGGWAALYVAGALVLAYSNSALLGAVAWLVVGPSTFAAALFAYGYLCALGAKRLNVNPRGAGFAAFVFFSFVTLVMLIASWGARR